MGLLQAQLERRGEHPLRDIENAQAHLTLVQPGGFHQATIGQGEGKPIFSIDQGAKGKLRNRPDRHAQLDDGALLGSVENPTAIA